MGERDWKEEIAARLRNRKSSEDLFEILLNQMERSLDSLLVGLSREFTIKTKCTVTGEGTKTVWNIKIEDVQRQLDLQTAARYYREHASLENALIAYILDEFKFGT